MAVGDGVTNDTNALQTALDLTGSFGRVMFRASKYLVTGLTLYEGQTIIGMNSGVDVDGTVILNNTSAWTFDWYPGMGLYKKKHLKYME